jgi:hypothetical protein
MDSQSCNSAPNHATTASSRAAAALMGARREAILDIVGILICGASAIDPSGRLPAQDALIYLQITQRKAAKDDTT